MAERLLGCQLQAAFTLDRSFDQYRRPHTTSSLGIVSHGLAEQVANGEFDDLPSDEWESALTEAWKEAIAGQFQELRKAWRLAPIPPPERWPGYEMTRVRLMHHLVEQLAERRHRRTRPEPPGRVEAEATLEAPEEGLVGRPDRVEVGPAGVTIVDLKSGWAVSHEEIGPAHRRQLLIYAYLWHAVSGDWPSSCVIERLDGTRVTMRVDPDEARVLTEQLRQQMGAFNQAVESGDIHGLASPGPETCRFCDYRGACQAFFEAADISWGWYRKSLLGDVVEVRRSGGAANLELSVQAGMLPDDVVRCRLIGLPHTLAPPSGSLVAVIDALPGRSSADLRIAWDTQVWRLTPP